MLNYQRVHWHITHNINGTCSWIWSWDSSLWITHPGNLVGSLRRLPRIPCGRHPSMVGHHSHQWGARLYRTHRVSINASMVLPPKMDVGKSYSHGWLRSNPILGSLHVVFKSSIKCLEGETYTKPCPSKAGSMQLLSHNIRRRRASVGPRPTWMSPCPNIPIVWMRRSLHLSLHMHLLLGALEHIFFSTYWE